MLCNFCNENEATLHFNKIVKNKVEKVHICEKCAREKIGFTLGIEIPMDGSFEMPESLDKMFSEFFSKYFSGNKEDISALFNSAMEQMMFIENEIEESEIDDDDESEDYEDIDIDEILGIENEEKTKDKSCSICGMELSEFLESSELGCGFCYDSFKDEIAKKLGKKLEELNQNENKSEAFQIQDLKTELDLAVAMEDYERASLIRDKISEIVERIKS